MRQRSWWVAAGTGVAVAALIGVVAVISAGSPGSGEAADGTNADPASTGGTSTGGTSTGDTSTSSSDARSAAPSGGGSSGDAGTAVAPPVATRPPQPPEPGRRAQPAQPRPQPSVVAPRAQAPRPDLPLALAVQSYELVAPDRLQVRYASGLPECYGPLDRAYVSESAERVMVILRVRPVARPSNEPCPDIALVEDTLVRLDEPLGDRTVVDGASGHAVRRGHGAG